MAAFKLTLIMKYLSGDFRVGSLNRSGSFSESIYWTEWTDGVKRALVNLAQKRAALLPSLSAVTGYRVQQVDPTGSAQSFNVNFPGPVDDDHDSDIPQMGILQSLSGSGLPNVKRHRMAAIPDPQVTRGEFRPSSAYALQLATYFRALEGWRFRGADLSQAFRVVKTIAADGTYELSEDLPLTNVDTVTIRKAKDAQGRFHTGTFKLESVVDNKHGKLLRWDGGACTGGRMRKFVPVYPVIQLPATLQPIIITRKIGRPSKPYVGHRSKKRS